MAEKSFLSSNTSGLAGSFLHEVTHEIQAQKIGIGAVFMDEFLNFSIQATQGNKLQKFFGAFAYIVNPVELAAAAAGTLSVSYNVLYHPLARALQGLSYSESIRHGLGLM